MKDSPFSCVVIGARGVGAIHVREFVRADIAHIAVAGKTEVSATRTAQDLSALYNRRIHARRLEDAVRSNPTLVSVCVPTPLHLPICMSLLETDCHILVEKPLFWDENFSRQEAEETCKRIFDAAKGRLAVNNPTSLLAESFLECVGPIPALDTIVFSYHTGGRHTGQQIAVDLLPHALSLLKHLSDSGSSTLGPIKKIEKRFGLDNWSCQFETGLTKCSFMFEQNPAITRSEMAFRVNNYDVQRIQVPKDEGFEVFLKIGDSRYPVLNPMSSSIGRALATVQNGGSFSDQEGTACTITRLMADLLID